MGCDIHFVIERKRKHESKYIGVYSTCEDVYPLSANSITHLLAAPEEGSDFARWDNDHTALRVRDYTFFGALAGVRRDGPEPNGVPNDVSELTQSGLDEWKGDAHSHGHCTLYHFIHTWLSASHPDKLIIKHAEGTDAVNKLVSAIAGTWADVAEANPDVQYRVVYWFDN